jgi:SAM-dependent methyltransferase
MTRSQNLDREVVAGFDDEWTRFDQSGLGAAELQTMWSSYFGIFPWDALSADAAGFDAGCGSGRWAKYVAPRVGRLVCVDAAAGALEVARRNLSQLSNCEFHHASVDAMPIADESMDFGYSLGVLHHVPDTASAIRSCAAKLKPGAPFLIYLYYAFDNRPAWFRAVWKASELVRGVVSRMPHVIRYVASQALAALVYWPVARCARLAAKAGLNVQGWPLAFYRERSFYVMRTDALDRFGTRLEQRFTRDQVAEMLADAGLERVSFSPDPPYWCAVAWKKQPAA